MSFFGPKMTLSFFLLFACTGVSVGGCGGSSGEPLVAPPDTGTSTVDGDSGVSPEDTQETDAPGPDITDAKQGACEGPGAAGCPCEGATDCASGMCTAGPESLVCTGPCEPLCEAGWRCQELLMPGGATENHCIPDHAALCRPCTEDLDCVKGGDPEAICIEHADGAGSYCGAACDETRLCPQGYTCEELSTQGGEEIERQCVPLSSNGCDCSVLASSQSASTTCSLMNDHGTCTGERVCGLDGLSSCSASTASEETCNGIDDDCDGETDNGLEKLTCGFGVCAKTVPACENGLLASCDDITLPTPETEESCNGFDDDCDGDIDEELGSLHCGVGLCAATVPACSGGLDNACVPLFQPGDIPESCNGIDDDCDGETDEELDDCG